MKCPVAPAPGGSTARSSLRRARQWQADTLVADKASRWQATEGLQLLAD